jgi:hypothetical protein
MTTSSVPYKASARAWLARGPAGWLVLAASPTYALMAWIAANDAPSIVLCASGSSIHRMAAMYGLMSLFHMSPWLKLAPGRPWART